MNAHLDVTEALRPLKGDPKATTADAYAAALGSCPVSRVAIDGSEVNWWGALGHSELQAALRDFKSLSSTVATEADGATPAIFPLFADPPLHTGYRKLLNPNFPPEVVGRLEVGNRAIAVEMITDLIGRGKADFAKEYTYPFPTRVLCRFLGVPDEDWPVHHEFVMATGEQVGFAVSGQDDEQSFVDAMFKVLPYVQKVIDDHRANPREDIVSSFISGHVKDRSLTDMEISKLIIAMMLAGHGTTTAALSNTVLRLALDQDLQDRLRAEPHRIPDALEESLRLDTPQQALSRKCIKDTVIGGQAIAAGEYVLTSYGSANVDPRKFPDPGRFDLDREDKGHLSFGFGLHACLGQHFARMNMRLTLEELLARTSSFSVAGDVIRRSFPVLSVDEMPLEFHPAINKTL
ncbi:cytochrome P450 [Nocardia bovistercoris]|uniref:Cytochrome P450 n=1 Tax=Nocardia bovistercoris TaxID=2785916 RepID=A0A931N3A0_9NOCA|nr:cytochrome P450 [Nocardia bovistercoris]MBH0776348.1 cytochrome P450 [Nocardia bovistercoris]